MSEKENLDDRLSNIERKLDLIIDAFGLSGKRRLAPIEIDAMVKKIIAEFNRKKTKA